MTEPGAAPPSRRSRWLGLGVVVLLVVLAAVVVVLLVRDDGGDGRRDDPALPASPGAVDTERQELVDLLGRGREVEPVHLRYEGTGPADDPDGLAVEIELWRSGGLARTDTTTETPEGPARTAVLSGGDSGVSCVSAPDEEWTCEESGDAGDADSSITIAEQITNDIGNTEVEVRDDEIDGRAVRCFSWGGDDTGEVCVEPDGIVALVRYAGTELRLVERDDDVPVDVFDPPA